MALPASPEDLSGRLSSTGYIPSPEIATTTFLGLSLERPVLVEGPAGVGKTELARSAAKALGRDLIRLQCYEGLDEAKALYEWEYAKQLLYTQILKDKLGELLAGATTMKDAVDRVAGEESAFFSSRFLLPRPLLQAIRSEAPVVLLIDEVDKADPEFEAFLLEVLSEWQVTVPELGTLTAKHKPLAIVTSNAARELSDALKRRCLYLWIDHPTEAREREILKARVPAISDTLAASIVATVRKLRELDLKKSPAIAETVDWARALLALGAQRLDKDLAQRTAGILLKYEEDLRRAARTLGAVEADPQ
jgi:MoxR-like ATPase